MGAAGSSVPGAIPSSAMPASAVPASAAPASALPASTMPTLPQDDAAKRARTDAGAPVVGLQTMYDPQLAKRRRDPTPNPGLNPDLEKYEGQIKSAPDEDTGFGFIKSPSMTEKFQRDAFLHNKNCPWIFNMDLKKDEWVVFQVVLNERQQPAVTNVVRKSDLQAEGGAAPPAPEPPAPPAEAAPEASA